MLVVNASLLVKTQTNSLPLPFLNLTLSSSSSMSFQNPVCFFAVLSILLLTPAHRFDGNSSSSATACTHPQSSLPFSSPHTGACGKTSLLCSFALGRFPKEYVSPVFQPSTRSHFFFARNQVSTAIHSIQLSSNHHQPCSTIM